MPLDAVLWLLDTTGIQRATARAVVSTPNDSGPGVTESGRRVLPATPFPIAASLEMMGSIAPSC